MLSMFYYFRDQNELNEFTVASLVYFVAYFQASNSASQVSTSPSKRTAADTDLIVRTKQVFERLFPNVPSNTDYDAWLTNLSKHIEQLNQQQSQSNHELLQNNNSKPKVANSVVSTNGDETATTATPAAASNGNHLNDNGASATTQQNPNEELVLQNAKLKTTVDEYKTIIAETVRKFNSFAIR